MSGPIVVRLPRKVSNSQFLSMGAISCVYRITESIVVKYRRDVGAGKIERENAIYDIPRPVGFCIPALLPAIVDFIITYWPNLLDKERKLNILFSL